MEKMLHFKFLLAVILIFINISHEIILETTNHPEPWVSDCKKISFRPENYLTCFCLKGIYAFKTSDVSEKSSNWRIIGAPEESCHRLGEWVSEIKMLSESMQDSLIRQLVPKSNSFIVTNIEDWQVQTVDKNYNQKTYCLSGARNRNSYCLYQIDAPVHLAEHHFQKGCEVNSELLSSMECNEFTISEVTNDIEPIQCSLVEPLPLPKRKRDLSGPNATTFEEADEDVPPAEEELAKIKGNPDMMASISKYVKNQVKELIQQSDPSKTVSIKFGQKKQPPGQTLLRLCSKVAQKICSPVSEDTFTIALESFLTQQTSFHLKDMYISFPAYDRILAAMTECDGQAGNIMFVRNDSLCASKPPTDISELIKRNGGNRTLQILPYWAVARPDAFEVVVEVVWKVFLMAHSYCFKFFNQYFNDHHTFTTTMIHFFTNQIQDIWIIDKEQTMPEEKDIVAQGNYTTVSKWYGNLLGKAGDLLQYVDYCYRASRVPVGMKTPWSWNYPWYIRRPPRNNRNEWIYKQKEKRSVNIKSIKECVVNP